MDTITTTTGKKVAATEGQRAAIRATKKFRSMIPGLSTYAREVLGHDVRVMVGHTTQTDGKTIWIKPPYELSKEQVHTTCGQYEDDLATCEGCRVIDNIILYLHHEMSHIMHGSFEKYKFSGRLHDAVLNRLNKYLPQDRHVPHNWNYNFRDENTLAIASAIYPPLTAVVQALEDHRINEAHYSEGRDHLRKQMKIDSQRIIDEGVQNPDGSVTSWGEASPDSQMMIQILFDLQGNKTDHVLSEEVLADYEELEIAKITKAAAKAKDSRALLYVAAEATGKCMTRGYFQYDADLEALMGLLRILFGHGLSDGSVETDMLGNDSGPEEKGKVDEFHDGLRETLMAGSNIEGVPLNIAGLTVSHYPNGSAFDVGSSELTEASSTARNKAVSKARLVFEKNARVEHIRNQRRGKLNGRVLGKRAPLGDERMFAKRITPDTRKYGIVIGLDISGSTSGYRLQVIKETALAMADVCHRTGVSFEIYAHTGGMEDIAGTDKVAANVYEIKGKSDRWDTKRREILKNIGCGGVNLDGHTMQFYRKRLDNSGCTDNVLFYFTDGSMPAANYNEERNVLVSELGIMKRRGYTVVGVGVDTDSPKQYGLDTVVVHGPNDIAAVLEKMSSRIGQQVVQ